VENYFFTRTNRCKTRVCQYVQIQTIYVVVAVYFVSDKVFFQRKTKINGLNEFFPTTFSEKPLESVKETILFGDFGRIGNEAWTKELDDDKTKSIREKSGITHLQCETLSLFE
jgi:hypothetical protein